MYKSWPLEKLPPEFVRPELTQVMEKYKLSDPWEVVELFESQIAEYAGSEYAVAVDNCTDALFLCLKYYLYEKLGSRDINRIYKFDSIYIPKRTYISVPQTIIQAGFNVQFEDLKWDGYYYLKPLNIIDSAARFTKNMYVGSDVLQCLSFQIKKRLPIGKGGMILTNDIKAAKWLRKARYEGRDIKKPYTEDKIKFLGWNMYMCPEDAARGVQLFEMLGHNSEWPDCMDFNHYTDLTEQGIF